MTDLGIGAVAFILYLVMALIPDKRTGASVLMTVGRLVARAIVYLAALVYALFELLDMAPRLVKQNAEAQLAVMPQLRDSE